MYTSTPNVRHSFLTVSETITFKVEEKGFFYVPEGNCNVLEAKLTTFSSRFGMSLF
jgi:hypothetical protein